MKQFATKNNTNKKKYKRIINNLLYLKKLKY